MLNKILLRPVITEKSMSQTTKNRFTFAVVQGANKAQIAQEIAKVFKVKVLGLKTMIVKGKTKRVGKFRREKKEGLWKKAIVTLPAGQKIALFDTTENAQKT